MARYEIPVVFDVELVPPEPLGVFVRHEEDAVVYLGPDSTDPSFAPQDCVKVVTCVVTVP